MIMLYYKGGQFYANFTTVNIIRSILHSTFIMSRLIKREISLIINMQENIFRT